MIRKLMKTLLVLAMALALPMAALADTQHTLTIVPGDDMYAEPAACDLLKALNLSVTTGEKSGALTLAIDGERIATVAMSADATGLYVETNLLSDDVLYVTWDDGFAFITDMMKATLEGEAAASETEADPEALAAVEQMMSAYKTQVVAALSAGAAQTDEPKSPEEAMALLEEIFKDDPQLVAFYRDIFDRMAHETGDFVDEGRDAATEKWTVSMNGKDLVAICDTQYMRSIMEAAVKAEEPTLAGDALAQRTDEMVAEVKKLYEESEINIVVNAYGADEGETLVGMDMGMDMALTVTGEDGKDETGKMTMNMNYDRLTDTNGVAHTADMSMIVDDKNLMQMTFDLNSGADGVSDGMLAMLVGDEQATLVYHGENEGDSRVRSVNVFAREGATAIVAPAVSDRPVIGFTLTSVEAEESVLAGVEAATPDSATNVMKLSAEEMQTLAADAQTRVVQAMFTALGKLPASVTEIFLDDVEDAVPAPEAAAE